MSSILDHLRRHWAALAIAATVIAAFVGVYWLFVGFYLDAHGRFMKWLSEIVIERGFFPNKLNIIGASPLAYLVAAIVIVVALITRKYWSQRRHRPYYSRRGFYHPATEGETSSGSRARHVTTALTALAILLTVLAIAGFWHHHRDGARSYAQANEFVVTDSQELPASLQRLADGERGGACDIHDIRTGVESCINEGEQRPAWEARSSSATGARIVMQRNSGATPNTNLMTSTLAYMYHDDGSRSWTAIRDGNSRQPIDAVISWSGEGDRTGSCEFNGQHELNKAFDGRLGQNLSDEIAARYPEFLYSNRDMWGYCQGDKPRVVIPVTKQEGFARRTTLRPAGVLVIEGSPSGEANITHQAQVKPGDFPGPVYPISLNEAQQSSVKWSAGRWDKWFYKFGYEPSSTDTQSNYPSNYLLRDQDNGRLYWVTPMTPRRSDSEQLLAYSVTPADQVQTGSLNEHRIYVLNEDDPTLVNLDRLESSVSEAIRRYNPGFFAGSNQGQILEFLPVENDTWQVYAELGGRVVYRVSVPSDSSIEPEVTSLTSEGNQETQEQTLDCNNPDELENNQLYDCIDQFTETLRSREG